MEVAMEKTMLFRKLKDLFAPSNSMALLLPVSFACDKRKKDKQNRFQYPCQILLSGLH